MTDRISPEHRSWNMSRIRNKDTHPEKCLRSLLHQAGFRFRLHASNLPGKPDLVLPRYKTVIFVHGCYWHRHSGCKNATTPDTHTDFWVNKFQRTVKRDKEVVDKLINQDWRVITVWECELKNNPDSVIQKIRQHLTEVN